MADPKLDIKITTSADTRGAQQATTALQGTGKAAAEAGSKTKVAGAQAKEGFDKFSKAGNDAASVVGNLEAASKGGVAGLFGLANAMRTLIGIVRTAAAASGPIGLLVTVLGTLVGLFLALRNNSQAAGKEIDKTAGAAKGLKAVSLDSVRTELDGIATAAGRARTEFELLNQAKGRVDKSQTEARLAEIAVAGNLTEEQRVLFTDEEQRKLARRERERRLASVEQAQTSAQDQVISSSRVAGEAGTKLADAESRLAALRAAREKRDAAQLELFGLLSADGIEGRSSEDIAKSEARKAELQGVLDQTGNVSDEAIAEAEAEVKSLASIVSDAGAALAKLVTALELATAALSVERDTTRQEGDAAERKANAELQPKLKAARAQDQANGVVPAKDPVRYMTYAGRASNAPTLGEDGTLRGANAETTSSAVIGEDGTLRNAQAAAVATSKLAKSADGFYKIVAENAATTANSLEKTAKETRRQTSRMKALQP